tara:strand:- start:592 stop:774 length:183 start_codon:yes stop_codon:yes gene_type:complete
VNSEDRWNVIQVFIDWFALDDKERKDLNQSLQLYMQQEIWKEVDESTTKNILKEKNGTSK